MPRDECALVVESEERPLAQWDFVHCPVWTEHTIVGGGDRPCVVLAVGSRGADGIRFPFDEAAASTARRWSRHDRRVGGVRALRARP